MTFNKFIKSTNKGKNESKKEIYKYSQIYDQIIGSATNKEL